MKGLVSAVGVALTCAVLWASTQQEVSSSPTATDPDGLRAFMPNPEMMWIQKTGAYPDLGNVILTARISQADQAKVQDKILIGPSDNRVVLRDDGLSGDQTAQDGIFTVIAHIDENELLDRVASEEETIKEEGSSTSPVFSGRELVGSQQAQPFPFADFQAGLRVPFFPSWISPFLRRRLAASSLFITHPTVVQDPLRTWDPCTGGTQMGAWTFGHLTTEMANQPFTGIAPSQFVEDWLDHWLVPQTINTFNVPDRQAMDVLIEEWRAASGGVDLDLSIAPFRLLAIVNRVDLRRSAGSPGGYGGGSSGNNFINGGEGRFIFGVVVPDSWLIGHNGVFQAPVPLGNGCTALRFNVIFEYGIPKTGCRDVRDWGRQWLRLTTQFALGTPQYNAALQAITDQFVLRNANPLKPNRNAINQVRSNEIALQDPWELREFQLLQNPADFLNETTTADTPHDSHNNTPLMTSYILTGPRPVPLIFSGQRFLGGNPQVPGPPPPGFFWNGPAPLSHLNVAHNALRHQVSLAACNGCHARETDTVFVHVDPGSPALPATLSGFLTGITVVDPTHAQDPGIPPANKKRRTFNEFVRRQQDLLSLVRSSCLDFRAANTDLIRDSFQNGTALPEDIFSGRMDRAETRPVLCVEDFARQHVSEVH